MKKFLVLLLVLAGIYHFQGSNLSESIKADYQQVDIQQSDTKPGDNPQQHLSAQQRELQKTLLRIGFSHILNPFLNRV